jgi:hypothetical protein
LRNERAIVGADIRVKINDVFVRAV